MNRINPDIDIVQDIIRAVLLARPDSSFVKSLLQQYQERGGLSKRQLQGLHQKASKIAEIPSNKLATLEAMILKKPTRYKSTVPTSLPTVVKDEKTGEMITAILARHPQHKRVLFFQSKYENEELISLTEMAEIQKFYRLFVERSGTIKN